MEFFIFMSLASVQRKMEGKVLNLISMSLSFSACNKYLKGEICIQAFKDQTFHLLDKRY